MCRMLWEASSNRFLKINTSADATVAMLTSIWSVEDDHFLVKVRSHKDELLFLVIAHSI